MSELQKLIKHIEGNNESRTKMDAAQRKAAKKVRQRGKKEQEKLQAELEIEFKLKEQTRKEEEKRQELLKNQKEKLKEEKKLQEAKQKKKLKKLRQTEKRLQNSTTEETISAMVTIKKAVGKENMPPSVTVTFTGCTAAQEKLLNSLVEIQQDNRDDNKDQSSNNTKGGNRQIKTNLEHKVEASKVPQLSNTPKLISKSVNVTLAVEKNAVEIKQEPVGIQNSKKSTKKLQGKEVQCERDLTKKEFKSFGNLILPPGITLKKVIKTPSQPKINYTNSNTSEVSPTINQKGFIVVDTEKLVQQTDEIPKLPTKSSKRKKNKNTRYRTKNDHPKELKSLSDKAPRGSIEQSVSAATFTKTENGMVKVTRCSNK